jgi:hypothetical protein
MRQWQRKKNMQKTFKQLLAAVSISSSLWASFDPGYSLGTETPAIYNAFARIQTQKGWDVSFTASYLYWHAAQDGMELAYNNFFIPPADFLTPHSGDYLIQNGKFQSGFRLSLGMSWDEWAAAIEYVRFHQRSSQFAVPGNSMPQLPLWRVSDDWYNFWGAPPIIYALDLSSAWRMNVDIVDAIFGRPYYLGRQWTVHPYGGLRAAWILQNLRIAITEISMATQQPLAWCPIISHNRSNSWALGARMGCKIHWLLAKGFRMEGDLAGSMLYTRYPTVAHREDPSAAGVDLGIATYYRNLSAARPMADMSAGFGWGAYCSQQRYHIDFLASYDFHVMWRQNMMRSLGNNSFMNRSSAPGDLTVQGLSLTARLDF